MREEIAANKEARARSGTSLQRRDRHRSGRRVNDLLVHLYARRRFGTALSTGQLVRLV